MYIIYIYIYIYIYICIERERERERAGSFINTLGTMLDTGLSTAQRVTSHGHADDPHI